MPPESTTAKTANVAEGTVLADKYRVDRVIGQGGMGTVVAATHVHLQEKVALKFLHEAFLGGEAVERFKREGQAAVRLKSEHVARVRDIGVLENGAPYLVMEFLDGEDLSLVLERRGPLPLHEVVDFLLQACEAMAEAHALGIVHRDLKPQNLFLTHRVDGRPLVKVLDFGISKMSTALQSGEHLALTRSQAVLGTPYYMSPEQLRTSRHVDLRSDIWAMGVIAFELLGGRVPFAATSMTELAAMVLQDHVPDLRQLRPDLPPAINGVIARCLEKDPNARFSSVVDFAAALEVFAANPAERRADRIAAIAARMSGGASGSLPAPVSSPSVPAPISSGSLPQVRGPAGTNTARLSSAQTELAASAPGLVSPAPVPPATPPARSSRGPLLAIGGFVLVGATLGIVFMKRASPPPANASGIVTQPTASHGEAPPQPSTTTTAIPSATVTATASASPTSSAKAIAAATASAHRPSRPNTPTPKPGRAPSTQTDTDLPTDRH